MKRTEKTTFTASKFASLVGVDRAALTRRLSEQQARPVDGDGRGDHYSLRDLYNAAQGGNAAQERLRKLRAEADKLEHDLSVRRKEFISVAVVKRLGAAVMFEVKRTILNSPLPPDDQDATLREIQKLGEMDWSRVE